MTQRVAFAILAAISALGLQVPIPAEVLLITGGNWVIWRSACMTGLAVCIPIFFVGVGSWTRTNDLLVRFFVGAALTNLVGVALGAFSLLIPVVTIPFFVMGVFAAKIDTPHVKSIKGVSLPILALGAVIVITAAATFLVKGIAFDRQSDVAQLYFPMLDAARTRHTFWLDAEAPKLYWFLLTRGRGASLFFSSIAGGGVQQILSVIYLGALTGTVYSCVLMIVPRERLLALCAALIALLSAVSLQTTGRMHLEIGAFLLFIMWGSARGGRELLWPLVIVVAAVGIMVPQAAVLPALILAIAGIRKYAGLICLSLASGVVSFGVNQLYLGIAEVNPSAVFLQFVNEPLFLKWSSLELMAYVNNAQGIAYGEGVISRAEAILLALFKTDAWWVYPAFVIAGGLFIQRPERIDWRVASLLGLMFAAICLLLSFSSHGSLDRMLSFRSVVAPLVAVVMAAALARYLSIQSITKRLGLWCVAGLAMVVAMSQGNSVLDVARLESSAKVAVGIVDPVTYLDPRRCQEVDRLVPEGWKILPVNSALNFMPACAESPLLPAGRVIESLYPIFFKNYADVVVGPAEKTEDVLRRLAVNAFYFERNDLVFWAHGHSPLFDRATMAARLGVLHEGTDYIVLTWKELSNAALTEAQLDELDELRRKSRSAPATREYWVGVDALRRFVDRSRR